MSFIPQGRPVAASAGQQKRPGGGHPVSDKPRQTLLFSATFSNEVKQIAASFLRPGYTVVDTVGEEVEQTHAHVDQHLMVVPMEQQVEVRGRRRGRRG